MNYTFKNFDWLFEDNDLFVVLDIWILTFKFILI